MAPAVIARCMIVALALCAVDASAFDLQGHRGARGLAPENTMAAFRRALDVGVTTIETDLAVTRDNVVVIGHDPLLNPDLVRSDGRWLTSKGPAIRALTLAELRRYDIGRIDPGSAYAAQFSTQVAADGERFPTLAELLELVKGYTKPVRLNIETKLSPARPDETADPATFARLVVETVQSAGMIDRVTVQSFDWRTLMEVRKLAPTLATACLTTQTENSDNVKPTADGASRWTAGLDLDAYGGSVPRLVHAAGCAIWSPNARNVTAARIDEAHKLGLRVVPWTVNDPALMARLIDLRVDGLITDYPDRLRKVMTERGIALP